MKLSLVAAGVMVLALSELVRAADEARFYPPEGWRVTKQPEGAIATALLQPPGIGKVPEVLIMPDVQGEVDGVFATTWRKQTERFKIVSGGEPRARRSRADLETRSTSAVVEAPNGERAYMHFFTVQAGPTVRQVLFISEDRASFDKHLPTVKVMLENVGIAPAKLRQQAATAPATGPGFEGVFYRGGVGFNAAGGRGELGQRVEYLCFAPDGRAYNGHPSGGPSACFENDDPRSPSYGRYTLNDDEIVITWKNQPQPQKLKRRPDGELEQDGGTFHKIEPCDGLKLDGTYATTWADGSKTRVRFTKDGRFTEQGLKDCVNLDNLVYPDWPKLPASGAGTYSIGHNTLEVKYDNDGPTRRMFFSTPDDATNPKRISIAFNPLEREP